ncbi:MAG: hypothetical protein Q9162_003547 [Coniocarpon cinnabarinum]
MALSLLLLMLLALVVVVQTISAIFKISFHPLAKIPGPWLAAVTKWYEFYADTFPEGGGRFAFEIERLHQRYGPIVRLTPNEVHIDDPYWLKTLFGGPGTIRDKDASLAHIVGNNLGTFGTVNHHLHRMRRAAVSPFFSKKSVSGIQPRIHTAVDRLSQHMRNCHHSDQVLNVRVTYLAWSTDSLTSYVFDQSTKLLNDPTKAREWWEMYDKLRTLCPILKQCLWIVPLALKPPVWVVRLILPSLAPLVLIYKDMHEQSSAECQRRDQQRADGKARDQPDDEQPNIFRTLLASNLPDPEKDYHRIAHDGFEILAAGSATFSRVAVAGTYHVLANPTVLAKLKIELYDAFPNATTVPEMAEMDRLPYLVAVVKESLRIAHIVTFRTPLIATGDDLEYAGYKLPAGTAISMTQSSALMDPRIYPNPRQFLPERWVGQGASNGDTERFFVPFGMGNRMCLGMNFAMANLYALFATIFRRFELELVDTVRERDVDHSRSWFIGEPAAESMGVKLRVAKVLY